MSDTEIISSKSETAKIYRFGSFRLEVESRRLWQDNRPVKLTAKNFDVLLFLIKRSGKVVERDELLRNIWRENFVEEANLTVHINALRKLLGDTQSEARFIATVWRRGYCFVATVLEINHETNSAVAPRIAQSSSKSGNISALNSLAVLPLRNLSQSEEFDYLADGVTQSLISSLSKLPQLKVLASDTVFRYKGSERTAVTIGNALGVAAILIGSLRRVGEKPTVNVELVSTEDGRQLWGAHYHEPLADVFEMQENIALAITEKLLPRLSEAEKNLLENRQTENGEAYRAYLKGRYFLSRLTTTAIEKALRCFERAVELDPNYALAHVRIGLTYYNLNTYYQIPYGEALALIAQAIKRAFEIDPDLSEAHTLQGIFKSIYEWDWTTAGREFRLGVESNPNSVFARASYANYLKLIKNFDEAWRQWRRALEIDPLSLSLNTIAGSILYCERRYEETIVHLQEILEIYPDSLVPHEIMSLAFQQLGDSETALAMMKKAHDIQPNAEVSALLGAALANAHRKHEARKILNRIERTDGRQPFEIFYLYLALGQIDKAIAFFEKSLDRREVGHIGLNVDARADALRSDAKFLNIFERMAFPSKTYSGFQN